MLVYRVFPYRPEAREGEPGHPLSVHPDQGWGRWDNPDRYRALYVSSSASGAIGESFAHVSVWSRAMLPFPAMAGAVRTLGVYSWNEERHPLLDLDDARALLDRGLRPTDVVKRNRPRTQAIARAVFDEGVWSGLSWWSMHRPQWTLHALWDLGAVALEDVEGLPAHPAVPDAGTLLGKVVDRNLL